MRRKGGEGGRVGRAWARAVDEEEFRRQVDAARDETGYNESMREGSGWVLTRVWVPKRQERED